MHKDNCFDTARLVAALMVMFAHQSVLSGLDEPSIFGFGGISGTAVAIFFSISGFLVSRSAMRSDNFIVFMGKRVRRIFPALIPCAIFMYVIVGGIVNDWNTRYLLSGDIVTNIIKTIYFIPVTNDGISSAFKHPGLNGSLWTLPLEFMCYLFVSVFVSIWKDKRVFILLFIISFIAAIFFQLSSYKVSIFYIPAWLFPLRAMAFFFGAILAMYIDAWNRIDIKLPLAVCLTLFMYTTMSFTLEYSVIRYIVISFLTISVCVSFGDPLVKGRFDYSYGIYIYAFPIQQLVINYTYLGVYSGLVLTACITLLMASLSWHFVESRFVTRSNLSKVTAQPEVLP